MENMENMEKYFEEYLEERLEAAYNEIQDNYNDLQLSFSKRERNKAYQAKNKLKNKLKDKKRLFLKMARYTKRVENSNFKPKSWTIYKAESQTKISKKNWYEISCYLEKQWCFYTDRFYLAKKGKGTKTIIKAYFYTENELRDNKGNRFFIPKDIIEPFISIKKLSHIEPKEVRIYSFGFEREDFNVEGGLFYNKPVHGGFVNNKSLFPKYKDNWTEKKVPKFSQKKAIEDYYEDIELKQEIANEEYMEAFCEPEFYEPESMYVDTYEGPFTFEYKGGKDIVEEIKKDNGYFFDYEDDWWYEEI